MRRLLNYQDELMLYGLASLAIVAGLTKFIFPEVWLEGIEHLSLPFQANMVLLVGGIIEAGTGMVLLTRWKSYITASIICVWLLATTILLVLNSLWLIAMRDLWLTVFASIVAINEYRLSLE